MDMPAMALVTTATTDAIVSDSASTTAAYATVLKTCNGAGHAAGFLAYSVK
jgi:alkaline phosphatase